MGKLRLNLGRASAKETDNNALNTEMSPAPPDRNAPPRLGDYDVERKAYRPAVPDRFNAVVNIIERWAAGRAAKCEGESE